MFVLISILLLSGCAIRTPQINGLVLDEETKQPVPDAWVSATMELNIDTVAGRVNYVFSVDKPHTRSDKEGRFVIPSKNIKKPLGFGTEVKSFGVGATTSDYRGGGLEIKDKVGAWGDVEVTIYLSSVDKSDEEQIAAYMKDGVKKERAMEIMEGERFSALQALYNYCITGRFAVEVPAVEGGCDAWELDYAIKKHERYLEKFGPNSEHAGGTLLQLGYLYKKIGEYFKAIEAFKKNLEYDKKRNIRFRRYESENQIIELEKLINENSTK